MRRILALCLVFSLAGPLTLVAAQAAQAAQNGDFAGQDAPADDKQVALDALLKQLAASDDEDAAEVLEKAVWQLWLQSGSDTIDLLMSRVVAAMEKDDYSLALDLLDHIVELKPGYAEGWNKRATVFFNLREYNRALHDVERTLRLEPRHFGALAGLGLIFQELGQEENALRAYRRALAVHPFLPSVRKAERELAEKIEGRGI